MANIRKHTIDINFPDVSRPVFSAGFFDHPNMSRRTLSDEILA